MDFLQIEQPNDFFDVDFFAIVLRRPTEQAEIIADRFGEKAAFDVGIRLAPGRACSSSSHPCSE